jgi:hypothetical protein
MKRLRNIALACLLGITPLAQNVAANNPRKAIASETQGTTPEHVRSYGLLGLSLKDVKKFHDTEKPNALFVFPILRKANPDPFFYSKEAVSLFNKIREAYDVQTVVARSEKEVYAALDNTPNIELLVMLGHGSNDGKNLYLGNARLRISKGYIGFETIDERNGIDIGDREIAKHFSNLSPKATIFLGSCNTGKVGGLADFLANYARGRWVIAPKASVSPDSIVIESLYPLAARFTIKEGDVTRVVMRD